MRERTDGLRHDLGLRDIGRNDGVIDSSTPAPDIRNGDQVSQNCRLFREEPKSRPNLLV